MKKSLATRLILIETLILFLTGLVHLAVLVHFNHRRDHASEVLRLTDEIVVQSLEARRSEKDFMLRSLEDDSFFRDGQSEFLTRHNLAMERLRLALDRFQVFSERYDHGVITEILRLIGEYDLNFAKFVAVHREMGTNRQLFERQLQEVLFQMVHLLSGKGQGEMLLLLHELGNVLSRYALRGDERLRFDSDRKLTDLENLLEGELAEEMSPLVGRYRELFATYVQLWGKIGFDEKSGYQGTFRRAIHQVEPLVRTVQKQALEEVQTIYYHLLAISMSVYLLGLLLGCLFFFIFAKRITRDLVRLKEAVTDLGGGHLEARVVVPRQADEVQSLAMVFNEMTERLQETTVSREYVNHILQTMAESVLVMDAQGMIYTANPAAERLLGYAPGELEGMAYARIVGVENAHRLFQELETAGRVENQDLTYVTQEGVAVPVLFNGAVMLQDKDCSGDAACVARHVPYPRKYNPCLRRFVCVAQNIKERKEAEEITRQCNQELLALNTSKDRFFSIISHDLKGPFTTLLGFAELLVNGLDHMSKEKIRKMTQHILESARQQHRLLDNLLTWSRLQMERMAVNPTTVDVGGMADDIAALWAEEASRKGVQITNQIDSGTQVQADPDILATILRNLLSNAIKFTSAGGMITLSGEWRQGRYLLSVADTGVGMTEEVVANLFRMDNLHSTRGTNQEKGTGLGLILCKELAMRNGGDLEVESTQGRGTTMRLAVPSLRQE